MQKRALELEHLCDRNFAVSYSSWVRVIAREQSFPMRRAVDGRVLHLSGLLASACDSRESA